MDASQSIACPVKASLLCIVLDLNFNHFSKKLTVACEAHQEYVVVLRGK